MNRHWNGTILPLFKKIKPKHIVEIGSDKGRNTINILKFCEEHDSKLSSIDPKPSFDVNKFKEKYGDKFELYDDLSLNILPVLDDFDVVLIDGDHNWYTVFNELKTIEKIYHKNNTYPFILFHDVCWPYGRRDLYYNPETIPIEYRLPYEEKGMIPKHKELFSGKGINYKGFNNAVYEGGKHNGVLTAIEDYIDESLLDLSFYLIPAYYGLGILFLKNDKIQKIVESTIDYSKIMKELEEYYLTIIYSKLRVQINKLNQENNKIISDFKHTIEENKLLEQKIKNYGSEIKILNKSIKSKDKHIDLLIEGNNEKIHEIKLMKNTVNEKCCQINSLNKNIHENEQLITSLKKEQTNFKRDISKKENNIELLLKENIIIKRTMDEKNNQIKSLEEKIEVLNDIIREKDKLLSS